jgi:hypothetical protein
MMKFMSFQGQKTAPFFALIFGLCERNKKMDIAWSNHKIVNVSHSQQTTSIFKELIEFNRKTKR